ncbi:MAG: hypothetical protein ACRDD1_09790 [Planctomycetia bacterium]
MVRDTVTSAWRHRHRSRGLSAMDGRARGKELNAERRAGGAEAEEPGVGADDDSKPASS